MPSQRRSAIITYRSVIKLRAARGIESFRGDAGANQANGSEWRLRARIVTF